MPVWFRIILGLVIMVIGFYIVLKSRMFISWTGRIEFGEKTFGAGGTEFLIKLIGVTVGFIGIFIATNIISGILESFAGLFIRGT